MKDKTHWCLCVLCLKICILLEGSYSFCMNQPRITTTEKQSWAEIMALSIYRSMTQGETHSHNPSDKTNSWAVECASPSFFSSNIFRLKSWFLQWISSLCFMQCLHRVRRSAVWCSCTVLCTSKLYDNQLPKLSVKWLNTRQHIKRHGLITCSKCLSCSIFSLPGMQLMHFQSNKWQKRSMVLNWTKYTSHTVSCRIQVCRVFNQRELQHPFRPQ